jgi:hypothetical protein
MKDTNKPQIFKWRYRPSTSSPTSSTVLTVQDQPQLIIQNQWSQPEKEFSSSVVLSPPAKQPFSTDENLNFRNSEPNFQPVNVPPFSPHKGLLHQQLAQQISVNIEDEKSSQPPTTSLLPSLHDMFPGMYSNGASENDFRQVPYENSSSVQQSDRSAFHRPDMNLQRHSPMRTDDSMDLDLKRHSFPPRYSSPIPSFSTSREEHNDALPSYNEIRNSIQNLPRQPVSSFENFTQQNKKRTMVYLATSPATC